MIIVSQDNKCILNFDNIVSLFMLEKVIYESVSNDLTTTIGRYDTEERALEILRDIPKCYENEQLRVLMMPEK